MAARFLAYVTVGALILGSSISARQAPGAVLLGQVIEQDERGVSGAVVQLRGGPYRRTVIATKDGRFAFRDVPRGRYRLDARKPGYFGGAYGQSQPDGPALELQIDESTAASDIRLWLWKQAIITGEVRDDVGDPLAGLRLGILRCVYVAGRERFQFTATRDAVASTDDRGIYRFANLLPGKYILVVLARQDGGIPPGTEGAEELPAQFYPGTTSISEAIALSVAAGEVRSGVDLHFGRAQTWTVSGVLDGTYSRPPTHAVLVSLSSVDFTDAGKEVIISRVPSARDGAFVFRNVPSGSYVLKVMDFPRSDRRIVQAATVANAKLLRPPSAPPEQGGSNSQATYWGEAHVVVDRNLSEVRLGLKEGARICGRLRFEEPAAAPPPSPTELDGSHFMIFRADGGEAAIPTISVEGSGKFCSAGLPPGHYQLSIPAGYSGWHLRSIATGTREATGSAIELGTTDIDNIEIRFAAQDTRMHGVVRNSRNEAVRGASILVFPTDSRLWTDFGPIPIRLREARANQRGEYALQGLIPGEYYVVALAGAMTSEWKNPVTINRLIRIATTVRLDGGESKVNHLVVQTLR